MFTDSDTDSPRERSDSRLSEESVPGISLQRPSIDVGVPGPTYVIQRSSVELQIGSAIQEEAVQPQNASVESHNALPSSSADSSSTRGNEQVKTKRRLLPVVPGSPQSSRSNSQSNSRSSNSPLPSGSESDNELKIVESCEKSRDSNSRAGSVGSTHLDVPGSGRSSPATSDSGSESPRQGRYRKNSNGSRGRSLPKIPNSQKRSSKDSTSSMDIASDESPKMDRKLHNGVSSGQVHSGMDVADSAYHKHSDANGNVTSSQMIYLRHTEAKPKTKPRPLSEGVDMHRLKLPEKKKLRSASDSQGFRTEVSPDVLRDIEVSWNHFCPFIPYVILL